MSKREDAIARELQNDLNRLIQERLTMLSGTATVQNSLQGLLQHEAERIERKLGTEHARTRRIKARLQRHQQRRRTLEVERQLTRIEVPQVAEEAALVHGRIVDEDGLGIRGLTACIVDRSGEPVADVEEAMTTGTGYFAIHLEPETVDDLVEQQTGPFFLGLLTPRRHLIFRQPRPLKLARGARLFEEIKLDRSNLTAATSELPETVTVPKLTGIMLKTAKRKLKEANLRLGSVSGPSESDRSVVEKQKPVPEATVLRGTAVSLVVGRPKKRQT